MVCILFNFVILRQSSVWPKNRETNLLSLMTLKEVLCGGCLALKIYCVPWNHIKHLQSVEITIGVHVKWYASPNLVASAVQRGLPTSNFNWLPTYKEVFMLLFSLPDCIFVSLLIVASCLVAAFLLRKSREELLRPDDNEMELHEKLKSRFNFS